MEQLDLFTSVVRTLESLGIVYMVVGSFASGAYGEPRLTQDIDIVIETRPDQLEALLARFPSDQYYVSRDAAFQALEQGGQFNVIHPGSGNKIDFMFARRDPWGRSQLQRKHRVSILPDQESYAARPEDIIISKMIYYEEGGSEKHLRDIGGILRVTGEGVDRNYVREWAEKLGLGKIWEDILARL